MGKTFKKPYLKPEDADAVIWREHVIPLIQRTPKGVQFSIRFHTESKDEGENYERDMVATRGKPGSYPRDWVPKRYRGLSQAEANKLREQDMARDRELKTMTVVDVRLTPTQFRNINVRTATEMTYRYLELLIVDHWSEIPSHLAHRILKPDGKLHKVWG